MQRLAQIAFAALCLFFSSRVPVQAVDASTCGYDQGAAGWYSKADRSGPYALDGNCGATLLTSPKGNSTLSSAGTNRSLSVAITATAVMAANTARRGWKIKNDCANAVWVNFDAAAAATAGGGNIKIAPGGYLASEPNFVETGAMSAIAETAACALTAREH